MKRCIPLILIIALLILIPAQQGYANLSGDVTISFGNDDVSGNKSQSILDEGFKYTTDLNLNLRGDIGTDWNYRGDIELRKSSDLLLEEDDDIKLKKITLQLSGSDGRLRLGDLFTNYGRYFINQRYRGLELTYARDEGELSFLLGENQPAEEGEQYARYSTGARLDIALPADIVLDQLSLVAAYVMDDEASVSDAGGKIPLENVVYGTEFNFNPLVNLNLGGEISLSNTMSDQLSDSLHGTAINLTSDYQMAGLTVMGGLERVSPDYRTLGGSASSDRQELSLRARSRLARSLILDLRYRYLFNDLEGQLVRRTYISSPQLITVYTPEAYRGMRIINRITYRDRHTSDDSLSDDMLTIGLAWNYRINNNVLSLNVEKRDYDDHFDDTRDTDGWRYGIGFRSRYLLGEVDFRPRVELGYRTEEGSSSLTSPSILAAGQLRPTDNINLDLSISMESREIDSDFDRERIDVRFGSQYLFDDWGAQRISLELRYTDHAFSDDSKDYSEQRAILSYIHSF